MALLYFRHLSIEITRRCKATDVPCPQTGDVRMPDIEHRHIRNILKNAKYIHRFDITGGEPALNPKAIRYILKLLVRLDIHVGEFHIISQGPPQFASEGLIRLSTALLEFLDAQSTKTEPDMPGMRHIRSHDHTRDKEVTAVIKRGSARVVLRFREGCEERQTPTDRPVYLTSDNQVCGQVRLDADGMIYGVGEPSGRALHPGPCPSGRLLRYLKSTLQKVPAAASRDTERGRTGREKSGKHDKRKPNRPADTPGQAVRKELTT